MIAEKSREAYVAKNGQVATEIEKCGEFTVAEDYHQKYYLRSKGLYLAAIGDLSDVNLLNSPVAAKLNGFVSGHGEHSTLLKEIASYKLPPAVRTDLVERHAASSRRGRRSGC